MSIDAKEVELIAHLARLGINQDDVPKYQTSLNNILGLADQMQSVNTDGVEPMAHPTDATQMLREDIVTEVNQREHFQKNAPLTADGLYLVPKVVE